MPLMMPTKLRITVDQTSVAESMWIAIAG
jgi:hypothetical protein